MTEKDKALLRSILSQHATRQIIHVPSIGHVSVSKGAYKRLIQIASCEGLSPEGILAAALTGTGEKG